MAWARASLASHFSFIVRIRLRPHYRFTKYSRKHVVIVTEGLDSIVLDIQMANAGSWISTHVHKMKDLELLNSVPLKDGHLPTCSNYANNSIDSPDSLLV
jgi:hypothetical protein